MKVKPALCKLSIRPFDDSNWIWERKYDGARMIAFSDTHTLQARSGVNKTSIFPELTISTRLPAVVDGEVISSKGLSFQDSIQPRINRIKSISDMADKFPATFMAFDILYYDYKDLREYPLIERKEILRSAMLPNKSFQYTPYSHGGVALFAQAESEGWEGVVGKDLRGKYEEGKRRWLKVKVWHYEDFWAVGCTHGTGKRGGYIGALMLEDESGRYVGDVGTGITDSELRTMTREIRAQVLDEELVKFKVHIKYVERTNEGKLRFPVYLGRTNETA